MYCDWGINWFGLKNYIDCENMCILKYRYFFMFKLGFRYGLKLNNLNRKIL